jgi:hypothetical protein
VFSVQSFFSENVASLSINNSGTFASSNYPVVNLKGTNISIKNTGLFNPNSLVVNSSSLNIDNSGILTSNGYPTVDLQGDILTLKNTGTLNANTFSAQAESTLTINNAGTLTSYNYPIVTLKGNNINLTNSGNFNFNILNVNTPNDIKISNTGYIATVSYPNLNFTAKTITLENSGVFKPSIIQLTNTTNFSIVNEGTISISSPFSLNSNQFSILNTNIFTIPSLEIPSYSSGLINNSGTMSFSETMNISGRVYVKNDGTFSVGQNYNSSSTSVYVNCGTYTGSFNLNNGGKVINNGIFNTSQIDFGGSSSSFHNYGRVNASGIINLGGLGSIFYNEGIVTFFSGRFQSDGNLQGPSVSSKRGYFVWSGRTSMNSGTIGPNLNFRNSSGTSSAANMFNNVNGMIWSTGLTWGDADPATIASVDCPNADGSPSTPVPTQAIVAVGVDLTGLQPNVNGLTYEWWIGTDSTRISQITPLTNPSVINYITPGTIYLWAKNNSGIYSPLGAAVSVLYEVMTIAENGTITPSVMGLGSSESIYYYETNTSVAYTATAVQEYVFVGWKVDGESVTSNTDGTLTVIINQNKTIEAVFEKIIVYRSNQDAEWVQNSIFNYITDNSDWETINGNVVSTAVPVEIAHTITIPNEEEIGVRYVVVEGSGKLVNNGTLVVSDTLLLKDVGAATAQVLNNGDVVNNGVVVIRKTLKANYGWYFVSFPFNVSADRIYIAGTRTQATWGGTTDSGYDFFVGEYDTESRDALSSGAPNYTGTGVYWKNVSPKMLMKNKGYIIAADVDITLDFVSDLGETALFEKSQSETLTKAENNKLVVHHDWNLIGNPYPSAYDLSNATQDHAPYYFYSDYGYQVAMADEELIVPPFKSLFVQAYGPVNSITFYSSGRKLKAANVSSVDEEISLVLANGKYNDKTRIRLQEDASAGYDLGKDAVKFMSPKKDVPQLYSKSLGYNLSVSALPIGTSKVDLGMYIGEKGNYSIQLTDVQKSAAFKQVILVDNETGGQTDLLASEDGYSFESNSMGASKRFSVLLVAEGASAIGTAEGGNIVIQTIGDKAYISGLEGTATVNVYDVAGKLAQRFTNVNNGDVLTLNNAGVAIIEVNTATQTAKAKVGVKK